MADFFLHKKPQFRLTTLAATQLRLCEAGSTLKRSLNLVSEEASLLVFVYKLTGIGNSPDLQNGGIWAFEVA